MRAGWWFDPDWIINELGINSTITSPAHEEVVALDSQKDYIIRGYAYSSAPLFNCGQESNCGEDTGRCTLKPPCA
jgi:Mo-co oxidoreductase dimerisation domain